MRAQLYWARLNHPTNQRAAYQISRMQQSVVTVVANYAVLYTWAPKVRSGGGVVEVAIDQVMNVGADMEDDEQVG